MQTTTVESLAAELGKTPTALKRSIQRWATTQPHIYDAAGIDPEEERPAGFYEALPESFCQAVRDYVGKKGVRKVAKRVAKPDGELANLQAELERLRAELNEAQIELRDVREEFANVVEQLDVAKLAVTQTSAKLSATSAALQTARQDNENLALVIDDLRAELRSQADANIKLSGELGTAIGKLAKMKNAKGLLPILFIAIFVIADAAACGWIAAHLYEGKAAFVAFFAAVGAAVGYSGITNAIRYTGYQSDNWLWGFGIFQTLLHLCAFALPDYVMQGLSMPLGAAVIAISIPLATAGLALTMKTKNS